MAKLPTTPIDSFKHKDKRVNIPPQELSGFLDEDEKAPSAMLYPRDPSLDPQLVWQGKDEQDREDLAVLTVPVYIQEKIQPQAIIENVRTQAKMKKNQIAEPDPNYLQFNFFNDFNNIDFEDLVEFYQHEQNWSNRMILGDSLLVMNSLAEKEGLRGQVQMIYLDPPYGIKFGSNWQPRLGKRNVRDGAEVDLTREPEMIRAFRDTWELGIHSYLSYLRDRLVVAHELLTESGSVFVQIGDENMHLVRTLLDEVFGRENFCSLIPFQKSGKSDYFSVPGVVDYLIWYAKDRKMVKVNILFKSKVDLPKLLNAYNQDDGDGKKYRLSPINSQHFSETRTIEIELRGKKYFPGKNRQWSIEPDKIPMLFNLGILAIRGNSIFRKLYLDDAPGVVLDNFWDDTARGMFGDSNIYVVQTTTKVIQRCMLMTTDPGDLVLDPTCGSGTTAYVAEQWGRRWITIDTSRVSIALARMRLMSASYPFYVLLDSPEGDVIQTKLMNESTFVKRKGHFEHDLRLGFVYQRVPHITLKDIANNEEIDEIYERYQKSLDPLREEINTALGKNYEEWELPNNLDGEKAEPEATKKLARWWEIRAQRQAAIDDSIARNADVELLVDQPFEDKKRVRVSGPFTVESLSPHRVLTTNLERPESEIIAQKLENSGKFETTIIENLRASGIQNTRINERLSFTRLEAFSGLYLQASGEYVENGGSKRVAVCIGPEHGTVGGDLIREAAKEATKGIGFDLLVVLGFAFDPSITEEIKNYGKLRVLPARINPELMMGDLLQKTKNANLFTVFGEPDIELEYLGDQLVVKLLGVDIFDPTTGQIRSSKPEEIACWFIDDNYNGESFFIRQAYFTGMNEPYQKLSRTLRTEIDQAAWQMLYRTVSVPFSKPERGKIAVKVINDYGDEVLKVYTV